MIEFGNIEVFSKNLNSYIDRSGKSRNEICEALGFTYSTFASWCQGVRYPRIDKIEMLANYFGIQKSDLIEEHTEIGCDGIDEIAQLLKQVPLSKRADAVKLIKAQIRMML